LNTVPVGPPTLRQQVCSRWPVGVLSTAGNDIADTDPANRGAAVPVAANPGANPLGLHRDPFSQCRCSSGIDEPAVVDIVMSALVCDVDATYVQCAASVAATRAQTIGGVVHRTAWSTTSAVAFRVGLTLVVLAALVAALTPVEATASDPTIVRTSEGKARGTQHEGYRTFEGIPYAAPPVGALRFRAPQPPPRRRGTLDATAPRSQCAQLTRLGNPETFNEDCLYLNVTTPAGDSARRRGLAVMVWIHGGAFVYGNGAIYDAGKLARDGGVVVVTINYRLGPLGFLAHPQLTAEQPELGSGNFALQDQQAALRWVRRNARAFGGDPRKVTVFGESAGSASVCANIASPTARGLFGRAIAQSYSCTSDFVELREAEAAGAEYAEAVGCIEGDVAACLREQSAEALLRAWEGGAFVVGGGLLPQQPGTALATGTANRVDLMHGNTRDENRLFVPLEVGTDLTAEEYEAIVRASFGPAADQVLTLYPVNDTTSPVAALSNLNSDAGTALSTCDHLDAYEVASQRRGVRTYAYQFRDRTASPLVDFPDFDEGAAHATELPYLFPGLFGEPLTAQQQELSDAMVGYWTTFARFGRPFGKDLPRWPSFRGSDDVLGLAPVDQGGIAPVDVAAESNCAFWASLLP
jgi:para-nitrobenzyl esterase